LSLVIAGRYNRGMSGGLTEALLDWYRRNARDLPWRRTRDPYAIWVAEVMLQQTRVETVLPYYRRWMKKFPEPKSLAEANSDDVMSAWEGLGYYRRASMLQRAARKILTDHDGEIPRHQDDLRELPGVGKYTAAAIGAIAFDADVVALDGNLRRVLARLMDMDIDPRSPEGERRMMSYASALLPSGQASAFNQALMDLGATICLPRAPECEACPIAVYCLAFAAGTQTDRPVRRRRAPIPFVRRASAVIERRGEVLIRQRSAGGLLGGLWEFPGVEVADGEELREQLCVRLRHELGVQLEVLRRIGIYHHTYSHFRVAAHAFQCRCDPCAASSFDGAPLRWVGIGDLEQSPMGKVDRRIAGDLVRALGLKQG
jgi:A/G-specific adenine glycosylase